MKTHDAETANACILKRLVDGHLDTSLNVAMSNTQKRQSCYDFMNEALDVEKTVYKSGKVWYNDKGTVKIPSYAKTIVRLIFPDEGTADHEPEKEDAEEKNDLPVWFCGFCRTNLDCDCDCAFDFKLKPKFTFSLVFKFNFIVRLSI